MKIEFSLISKEESKQKDLNLVYKTNTKEHFEDSLKKLLEPFTSPIDPLDSDEVLQYIINDLDSKYELKNINPTVYKSYFNSLKYLRKFINYVEALMVRTQTGNPHYHGSTKLLIDNFNLLLEVKMFHDLLNENDIICCYSTANLTPLVVDLAIHNKFKLEKFLQDSVLKEYDLDHVVETLQEYHYDKHFIMRYINEEKLKEYIFNSPRYYHKKDVIFWLDASDSFKKEKEKKENLKW